MAAGPQAAQATADEVLLQTAELLFANGQTTERMTGALARLGRALGLCATTYPAWGEVTWADVMVTPFCLAMATAALWALVKFEVLK